MRLTITSRRPGSLRSEIYLGRDDLAAAPDRLGARPRARTRSEGHAARRPRRARPRACPDRRRPASRRRRADSRAAPRARSRRTSGCMGSGCCWCSSAGATSTLQPSALYPTTPWLDATRAAAEGDLRRSAAPVRADRRPRGRKRRRACSRPRRSPPRDATAEAEAELAPAVAYYTQRPRHSVPAPRRRTERQRERGGLARMTSFWHGFADMGAVDGHEFVVARGDGCYVWDEAGRRYLDGTASLWYANVGYGRREIADAVAAQLQTLHAYHTFGEYATRPVLDLADRLAAIAPGRRQQGLPHLGRLGLGRHGREARAPLLPRARPARADGDPHPLLGLPRHARVRHRDGGDRGEPGRRGRAGARHRPRRVGLGRRARRDDRPDRRRADRRVLLRAGGRRGRHPLRARRVPVARARDRARRGRAVRLRRGDHRASAASASGSARRASGSTPTWSRSRRASPRATCRSAASSRRRTSPSRSGAAA